MKIPRNTKLDNIEAKEMEMVLQFGSETFNNVRGKYSPMEIDFIHRLGLYKRKLSTTKYKLRCFETGILRHWLAYPLVVLTTTIGWWWWKEIWSLMRSVGVDRQIIIALFIATISISLINIYDIGWAAIKMQKYFKQDDEEEEDERIVNTISMLLKAEGIEVAKSVDEGEWIPISEVAKLVGEPTNVVGRAVKELGFLRKRTTKTRFLLKKTSKK